MLLFGGVQSFDPSGEAGDDDPIRPLLAAIDRAVAESVLAGEATSIPRLDPGSHAGTFVTSNPAAQPRVCCTLARPRGPAGHATGYRWLIRIRR
jgi:hypothetical protein